jgi:hypothetical protein
MAGDITENATSILMEHMESQSKTITGLLAENARLVQMLESGKAEKFMDDLINKISKSRL